MSGFCPDNTIPTLPGMSDLDNPLKTKLNKALKASWAGTFLRFVLQLIPVRLLFAFYSGKLGRPSKNIRTMFGLCIIQEMMNLTNDETVWALQTRRDVHYALGLIDSPTDKEIYACMKTFYNFKRKMLASNAGLALFTMLMLHFMKEFKVDPACIRMDSTHIKSNIKNLSRLGLFRAVISNFLRELRSSHRTAYDRLDKELKDRYGLERKSGYDSFGDCKPAQRLERLAGMARDLEFLVTLFAASVSVGEKKAYGLMKRLLEEQCDVTVGEDGRASAVPKAPGLVRSDSLQSPFDDGATYNGQKKQKGYKLQIAETCTRERKADLEGPALNLVVYVKAEGAHASDVHAFRPFVEELRRLNIHVEVVLADNGYNSIENHELAEENGIELVGPANNGRRLPEAGQGEAPGEPAEAPRLSLADFRTDDRNIVVACPEGQKAGSRLSGKGDACNAAFDAAVCSACPRLAQCPVKAGARGNMRMRYTMAALKAARNRDRNGTKANRDLYRQRSGIEGANSEMKKCEGIGEMRFRGSEKVQYTACVKAAGTNIRRVHNYLKDCQARERKLAREAA